MDVSAITAERDLGLLARLLQLDGQLPLPSGATVKPMLCQTDRGVWLVGGSEDESAARDLARNPTCRYESRLVGDRLHVDGLKFGIPVGRGVEARMALGVGRLLARAGVRSTEVPAGSFAESPGDLAEIWLSTFLQPGERPLAWLLTGDTRPLKSDVVHDEDAPVRFLLTTHRQVLVALNTVGDHQVLALDELGLGVEDGSGRCTVRCGGHSWRSSRSNAPLYRRIVELPSLDSAERLRRMAALEWPERPEQSMACLAALGQDQTAMDRVVAGLQRGEALAAPLLALDLPPDAIVEALEPWGFSAESLRALAVAGVEQAPGRAEDIVPLHRHARQRLLEQADLTAASALDIALAEHLLVAGLHDEVVPLLTDRLEKLPDESLSDLLPPPDADLAQGEAGQAHRIRCLELLAAATGGRTGLAELARLQPLVRARIAALADSDDPLAGRARTVQALHASLRPEASTRPPEPKTLSDDDLERVRHSAARTQGALGWLQGWVARQKTPDHQTLKDYCEPLNGRRHSPVVRSLTHAVVGLGTPGMEGYISHGKLSFGLRVYDDEPPYVLIGGDHVHDEGQATLGESELAFALGAEVAHLRFGHTRVTDGEVWAGAVHKVGKALDLAATALAFGTPVGKVVGDAKPWRLLSPVFSAQTLAGVQAVDGGAKAIQALTPEMQTALGANRSRHLGIDERELVVAHRAMQLSADRAGLLLCGDIRGALRSILATTPQGRGELAVAEEHGLNTALSRRGPKGELVNQELAIRIASLLRFYLSDEYDALREKLYSDAPSAPSSEPSSASV